MKRPRVVIASHVCIDNNVTERDSYQSWGSAAMFIADYYRRQFGLPTTIISSYGADFLPFAGPPQNITLIPKKPNQPGTLQYRNIITLDLRTWYCENMAYAKPPDLDNDAIAALSQADIFIYATLLPNYPVEYARKLLSYLPTGCLTVFGGQGYLRNVGVDSKITVRGFPEASELLPLFDITVLSDDDHPKVQTMAQGWKTLPGVGEIILTHGPDGASIIGANGKKHIPTTPIPANHIVDSVGCGDIFMGSLAYFYWKNKDLVAAVQQAHKATRSKLLATAIPATM
jgi:hypothetical protein